MHIAVALVSFVVAVLTVTSLAGRLGLPAPVALVVTGVAASYLPMIPEVRLGPEVVLLGLLPPLLYNAALQTSLLDFGTHRGPILSLSIGLVAFTTLGVGVVVHLVVPEVGWPAAFALGAVVAPPDAVAATAVARRIGLPRRLVTVLEGESLLNDATALVALKTAVLAATTSVSIAEVGIDFVRTAALGVLAGLAVYVVVAWVRGHVTDPVVDTSVSLVTPFIAYVLAEQVHASGVLAVVVAGLLLGHRSPVLQTPGSRIAERLNWRTLSFLLENSVFLLIGLQTSWILGELAGSAASPGTVALLCAVVLGAVVALRLLWVFPSRYLIPRGRGQGRGQGTVPVGYTAVVGWAGMRGVVTLAAAFVIPEETPLREVLVVAALGVVAGTLVLQGLTLPWLVRRLRVPAPDPREDALARAELLQQAGQAGLARLAEISADDQGGGQVGGQVGGEVGDLLRQRVEQREFAAWEQLGVAADLDETPSERYARIRLSMLAAERARVLELRSSSGVPHEVVADVLRALDVEESMLDLGLRRPRGADAHRAVMGEHRVVDTCAHLAAAPEQPDPTDLSCPDCVAEGLTWVHLRLCLDCGRVGCCDSSPGRHASAHHEATGHPVIRSAEPGERWRWCFVDRQTG